jgi:trimethylamine:corrinoid methyltransferase-like protein
LLRTAPKKMLAAYVDPGIDPAIDEALKEFIAKRKEVLTGDIQEE